LAVAALLLAACGQQAREANGFDGVWIKEYGECGEAARIERDGEAARVSLRGADKAWRPVDGAFEVLSPREIAGPDLTISVDGARMEWLQGGAPICAFTRE
jgi:hypothetical protein